MPLQRRVPKFGFKNINRVEYKAVNLSILEKLASEKGITDFNLEVFMGNGLTSRNDLVKILGRGELKSKINVSAHGFSKQLQLLLKLRAVHVQKSNYLCQL